METSQTFQLENEDHTLGHLLQQELLRNPDVTFTGYIAPHPLERNIKIKVQIMDKSPDLSTDKSIGSIMKQAVKNLLKKLDKIENEF